MSLQFNGVWKGGVWASGPWFSGVWCENPPAVLDRGEDLARMIGKALRAILTTYGPVASVVGNRVYPIFLPEKAKFPAIAFRRTSTQRDPHQRGGGGSIKASLSVSCISQDYDQAEELGEAVGVCFNAYRGEAAGIHVQSVFVEDQSDDPSPSVDGAGQPVFQVVLQIEATYTVPDHFRINT